MTETFHYKGYDIPVDLMRITGFGPESFEALSRHHVEHINKHVGIGAEDTIVEVGCGIGRDAIPLTDMLRQSGQYIGIDINNRSIEWCSGNITKKHPNFRFFHFDVAEQLYNPTGTLPISSCKIPVTAESVDLIIVQSVFTHMFEEGLCFYFEEFARVLKPSGKVYATFFVVDNDIRTAIRDAPVTVFKLSFRYEHGAGCFINDTEYPTFAVAFTPEKLEQMAKRSGLTPARALVRGYWSGLIPEADCGQDVMILGRVDKLAKASGLNVFN